MFASFLLLACLVIMTVPSYAEESDNFDTDEDYGFFDNQIISHELIGVWQPMIISHRIDRELQRIFINIDGSLLSGTDMACQLYGMMLKHLTRSGWIVLITNDGWIPGNARVIDHAYATKLARGY
jgi:hypothetical protein